MKFVILWDSISLSDKVKIRLWKLNGKETSRKRGDSGNKYLYFDIFWGDLTNASKNQGCYNTGCVGRTA